eukprot:2743354-Prymnesium_polylepis.1
MPMKPAQRTQLISASADTFAPELCPLRYTWAGSPPHAAAFAFACATAARTAAACEEAPATGQVL